MTAPFQRGEIVIRLPVLDPAIPMSPNDRAIEAEVMALMRHLRARSRAARPSNADTMVIAMIEATARTIAGLAIAAGIKPTTLQGFRALADNMTARATAMIEGEPFGPAPEPVADLGSSAEAVRLLDVMPPLHEEGDFGVLAHRIAGAMAMEGLKVLDMEAAGLSDQQKSAALVIAAAESAVIVALAGTAEGHAATTLQLVAERIKARTEQALAARKAKMG